MIVPADSLEDEQGIPGQDSLDMSGLAEKWEASLKIRQRARRLGGLLEWPSTETIGVPSVILGLYTLNL